MTWIGAVSDEETGDSFEGGDLVVDEEESVDEGMDEDKGVDEDASVDKGEDRKAEDKFDWFEEVLFGFVPTSSWSTVFEEAVSSGPKTLRLTSATALA